MNPVCHFEIPFSDRERAAKFYQEVFGWHIAQVPGMPYWMATTTEVDEKFRPKTPGTINGGFYERSAQGSDSPVVVMLVPSCDAHVQKVTKAGGSLIMGPNPVGEMGIYAQVKDSEGNIIGLWQSLMPQ